MRLLLDTHTFLWWLSGSERLPDSARNAIADETNEILVSAASAWEITTKHRLGKLSGSEVIAQDVPSGIAGQGFTELGITVHEASRAGSLAWPLRDPFDRMLIVQALVHDLVLVSNETVFDRYGVRRFWQTRALSATGDARDGDRRAPESGERTRSGRAARAETHVSAEAGEAPG